MQKRSILLFLLFLNNGAEINYPLSDIKKLYFSTDNLLIEDNNGSVSSWLLSNILKYLYDSNLDVATATIENNDVRIYPNPHTDIFNIKYVLNKNSNVKISLVSVNGKVIETIVNNDQIEGLYNIEFNNYNIKKGVYFLKIEVGEKLITKKIIK